jgi:hypothetical protein
VLKPIECTPDTATAKGLRQFLTSEQQRAWMNGEMTPQDAAKRPEPLEQRFKYVVRFEKLMRRPQVPDVLDILRTYAATCIPVRRRTERQYWSVSPLCLRVKSLSYTPSSVFQYGSWNTNTHHLTNHRRASQSGGLTAQESPST